MDRTNWKFGKIDINILMVGVAYKGMAVPLLWSLLDKKGNSNTDERIAIMERFVTLFGTERIKVFLADREFVGTLWIDWFMTRKIPFVLRIKKNIKLKKSRKDHGIAASQHFHLNLYEFKVLQDRYFLYGHALHVAAARGKGG